MKKILVVLGSPRKQGNSATLAQSVVAGAEAGGADVESFYLHEIDMLHTQPRPMQVGGKYHPVVVPG